MNIEELIHAALDNEKQRIEARYLPDAAEKFARYLESLRATEIPTPASPSPERRSTSETIEERLVTYLLEKSSEPVSILRPFLDDLEMPMAAGSGKTTTPSRIPIPASRLSDSGRSYWSPGAVDAGASLGSPTHPDLVSRGVVRLVNGRVEIDCAVFPADAWVLLVIESGKDVPLGNLVALYRSAEEAAQPTSGSAMDLLMHGMVLDAWESAISSQRTADEMICFEYMALSKAKRLAGEAIKHWESRPDRRRPGSQVSRFAEVPLWIDAHLLGLLDREILGAGGNDEGAADE
jgi:hypothetical protein